MMLEEIPVDRPVANPFPAISIASCAYAMYGTAKRIGACWKSSKLQREEEERSPLPRDKFDANFSDNLDREKRKIAEIQNNHPWRNIALSVAVGVASLGFSIYCYFILEEG